MATTPEIEYLESMVAFSKEIFGKCISDSDEAVRAISSVVELLLKDSNRISKMSEDTASAIKNLENVISEINQKTSATALKKLIGALSGLMMEHKSVPQIIMPIIEALQFQDALRQQMENLGRAMQLWMDVRRKNGANKISEEELVALGTQMLKVTTMQSERDLIRKFISGLGEEKKADSVMMF